MRPPWADSDSPWDRIAFGTLAFGGVCEVDGDALKRKVTRHRASGSNGSRITDRGLDTVEVTIRLIAWTDEHATQLAKARRAIGEEHQAEHRKPRAERGVVVGERLAVAVLWRNRYDSLPVSTMWQ